MSTFERRFTDRQRSLVYELKMDGKTGSQIAALCAQGVGDEPPFEIPLTTANRIAREEARSDLGLPSQLAQTNPVAALDRLAVNMMGQLEEWGRQQKPGAINTAEFARVGRTLEKLHSIARTIKPPEGNGSNGHRAEKGFIESLAEEMP
jgi:hypothetical protein